ncbi:lysophospholipase L1-like esterase [Microbacteriaceae bacterium SG_E_30_P1]|uniref:Lysophospholipase L1-like esterase n=1 Tax=Antiquaquibacter oligotrophicus TaxID=2880260 RepID=A0ABT6KPE0_9MICO|nr:SGNH/GDSL hydrolase family protein [Antiquaquibacter oligotrophicus]MDH6181859.1 lysophospholipase L1-like esterase [Antiquaquibacter oligotrophicus]UDF12464.1 SGNH/GDSL hydrolase family protein [Antiquaquibacter oligotrophicus]
MRRFAFALLGVLALAGCAQPAVVDTVEREGSMRVAFYGDSYTYGAGASDPSLRWSTIVSEQRDWTELNYSVNGLGFVNNRGVFGPGDLPATIIDDKPDIVISTMGLNDNFSFAVAADLIRSTITDDLTRFATELPDARIIVVEPFWYTDTRPESVEIINGWVRETADDLGLEYIEGASRWLEGHPEWMADDIIHPNDEGYAELARRMNEELAALGLPAG